MNDQARFVVESCTQPGWGEENWVEIARFESEAEALAFADDHGHFESRMVWDSVEGRVVKNGWRIEE